MRAWPLRCVIAFWLLGTPPGALALEQRTLDALRDAMERVNRVERKQREEYHAYLRGRGDVDESLEEHMARYARFARFGEPADPATLEALRRLSGPPLPPDLVDFYRRVGAFDGSPSLKGLVLHAPQELLAKSLRNEARPYEHLRSLGFVDMILWSWGNDRFEFEPASGEALPQSEIDALNARYSIVGWRTIDETEGFEYLYFDEAGRFGLAYFHQDDFDSFDEDVVKPLLRGEGPSQTLDEALRALLERAHGPEQYPW
jgi:hypothetical protein